MLICYFFVYSPGMDQPAGIGGDPHLCGRSEFSLDLIDLNVNLMNLMKI